MASIHFTPALKRFVPGLDTTEVNGTTVAEINNWGQTTVCSIDRN